VSLEKLKKSVFSNAIQHVFQQTLKPPNIRILRILEFSGEFLEIRMQIQEIAYKTLFFSSIAASHLEPNKRLSIPNHQFRIYHRLLIITSSETLGSKFASWSLQTSRAFSIRHKNTNVHSRVGGHSAAAPPQPTINSPMQHSTKLNARHSGFAPKRHMPHTTAHVTNHSEGHQNPNTQKQFRHCIKTRQHRAVMLTNRFKHFTQRIEARSANPPSWAESTCSSRVADITEYRSLAAESSVDEQVDEQLLVSREDKVKNSAYAAGACGKEGGGEGGGGWSGGGGWADSFQRRIYR
jgi:hypothetical protein